MGQNKLRERHKHKTTTSTSGSLDFFGVAKLTGYDRTDYIRDVTELFKYAFQQTDKRYLYLSAFSGLSLEAYEDCLRNSYRNIYIIPSTGSAAVKDFSVQVKLRDYPGDFVIPVVVKMVTGGEIRTPPVDWNLSNNKAEASGSMRPNDMVPISVSRNTTVPFELTVEVGKEHRSSETMRLAPVPAFELVEESRYSAVYTSNCHRCTNASNQNGNLSIALTNDEVIVPRSEYIEFGDDGSSPGFSPKSNRYAFDNIADPAVYSKEYHPHNVNIPISINTAPNEFD
jgi:hypothetical protein